MKKICLSLLVLVAFFSQALAQAPSFFSRIATEDIPQLKAGRGCETPNAYLSYRLDYKGIQTALSQAPTEFTVEALAHTSQIAIPMADGTLETFGVWQTAVMHPELAARYPEIRTYAGRSTTNSSRTVTISTTPRGFRAMILQPDMNVHYVEPFAFDQSEYYIAFDRRNLPFDQRPLLSKGVTGEIARVADTEPYAPPVEVRGTLLAEPVVLKTLRYTVACTGEFGQDHGGTKPLALAAVVEYTNQVTALFERDADLRLQLTPCTESCIFVNPQSDPFFGVEVGDWMAQNDQVVGLVQDRVLEPVDEESLDRPVEDQRVLPAGPDPVDHRLDRRVLRRRRADHLDQRHHVGRHEVVKAEEALLVLEARGELVQRQAGGVGGEDRLAAVARLDLGIEGALEVELLGNRLDDQFGHLV